MSRTTVGNGSPFDPFELTVITNLLLSTCHKID